MTSPLKDAGPEHAEDLSHLINHAGEGMPMYHWQEIAEPGQSPLEVGMARAKRETGDFSYKNARLYMPDDKVEAVCISFALADPYDTGDVSSFPAYIHPLIELESKAPGTWYINVLATYPDFRSQGRGTALLEDAFAKGRQNGFSQSSIIVSQENTPAKRLYERSGFKETARAPIIPYPGAEMKGEWLLLMKELR